jgi:hypothetical protein
VALEEYFQSARPKSKKFRYRILYYRKTGSKSKEPAEDVKPVLLPRGETTSPKAHKRTKKDTVIFI